MLPGENLVVLATQQSNEEASSKAAENGERNIRKD